MKGNKMDKKQFEIYEDDLKTRIEYGVKKTANDIFLAKQELILGINDLEEFLEKLDEITIDHAYDLSFVKEGFENELCEDIMKNLNVEDKELSDVISLYNHSKEFEKVRIDNVLDKHIDSIENTLKEVGLENFEVVKE